MTRALKLKRRPPFTTAAQRRIATTLSDHSPRSRLSLDTAGSLKIESEFQTPPAGGAGQGLDSALILLASTGETKLFNTRLPGPPRGQPADDRRGRLVAAVGVLRPDLGVERAGRRQRRAAGVVDHLRIDVLRAAEDGQP